MNLGAVLRNWRTMSELSTREVGRIIGLDHATLNRIEHGHPPSAANLRILLNWLLSEAK